jgi:CheY-like chemotaxis protein
VRDVIEEVAELLGPAAFQKGLELIQTVPPQFPGDVLGDRTRLRQVLVNLVGNAIKFTEAGEVTIETEVARETREWTELRILVRDSGIGITQLQAEKIFESFTQADDSSTRKYGGTGLGLAISRSLVELMGGRIGVESTPGHGSTFWVQIALPRGTTTPSDSSVPESKRLERRILVIDDCGSVRSFLREHLDAWGCLVEEAGSWSEGLKVMRAARQTNPFSAALVDLTLPDIDSDALAEAIGKNLRVEGVPVLLLAPPAGSGASESERLAELPRVRKPLRPAQLKRRLLRLLESGTGSAESMPPSVTMNPITQLSGLRVLLAEDNPVNQKLLHLLLSRWGCSVEVVATGKQALAAVAQKTFDVALMDVQMPDVDGITVTAEIRQREEPGSARLPIIAITAHAFEEDRRRCLAAGMDDFLSKPPDQRLLALMLARWGRGSSVETEAQGTKAVPDSATFQSEVIYSLFAGNAICAREVLSDFADKLGPLVEAVRTASKTGDRSSLEQVAHSLKGSSRSVGARAMSVIADRIEGLAPEGADQAIQDCILSLDEEEQRLRAVLEQHLRSKAA